MSVTAILALAVRIGTVLLFLPFSAMDKIFGWGSACTQAQTLCHWRWLARLFILGGLAIEVFASLAVITGVADRLGAAVLAAYCLATAALFKRFWRPGDFWAGPDSAGRQLFWDFLENLSLGAALFTLTVGSDGGQWRAFVAHPFASSHPYRSAR